MQKLDKRVNYLERVNKQNNVIVLGMRMNDQEQASMNGTLGGSIQKRTGSKRTS